MEQIIAMDSYKTNYLYDYVIGNRDSNMKLKLKWNERFNWRITVTNSLIIC